MKGLLESCKYLYFKQSLGKETEHSPAVRVGTGRANLTISEVRQSEIVRAGRAGQCSARKLECRDYEDHVIFSRSSKVKERRYNMEYFII